MLPHLFVLRCYFSKCVFSFLVPFSAKLVDGINRNDSRRRALMIFCFEYFNVIARVSYFLLSVQIAMLHGMLLLFLICEASFLLSEL